MSKWKKRNVWEEEEEEAKREMVLFILRHFSFRLTTNDIELSEEENVCWPRVKRIVLTLFDAISIDHNNRNTKNHNKRHLNLPRVEKSNRIVEEKLTRQDKTSD